MLHEFENIQPVARGRTVLIRSCQIQPDSQNLARPKKYIPGYKKNQARPCKSTSDPNQVNKFRGNFLQIPKNVVEGKKLFRDPENLTFYRENVARLLKISSETSISKIKSVNSTYLLICSLQRPKNSGQIHGISRWSWNKMTRFCKISLKTENGCPPQKKKPPEIENPAPTEKILADSEKSLRYQLVAELLVPIEYLPRLYKFQNTIHSFLFPLSVPNHARRQAITFALQN